MSGLAFLVFVIAFAGLVLIHEFGHFLAARFFKIEVEEFGIGIPPRVATLFTWRGTQFTLNALPLGGFVRPKGENDPAVEGGLAAANPWARLAVLLAGPAMNLIAGVLVYSMIFYSSGMPDLGKVQILDISANSPATQAGFKVGDKVLRAGSEPVTDTQQLIAFIRSHLDQPVEIVVLRDGKETTLTVTPSSKRPAEQGAVGVVLGYPVIKPGSWFDTLPLSVMITGDYIHEILTLPGRLVAGATLPGEARFIGLKGIYDFFNQAVTRDTESRQQPLPGGGAGLPAEGPTNYTLGLIATLTISLGVFNLVPLPALDGGRILFILPELIFRRRVSPQVENTIHAIGLALLLLLMVYINVMDFINPVSVTLP